MGRRSQYLGSRAATEAPILTKDQILRMQQVEQRISKDLLMKELQKNDVNKESNE